MLSFKDHKLVLPALFTLTAFVGASLIFLVQPLVSKLLLPSYGGSAAVWTTASFFFQVILLLGYLLVHGLSRLGPRRQPFTHVPLLILALIALPLALPSDTTPDTSDPTLWLIRTLLLMIALPFLVLSMTGPLLQKWYSWTNAPRAEDPYFLYAASNVGSFFGLLSYPFLIEPNFSLADQRTIWSVSFAAFMILMLACGVTVLKQKRDYLPESEVKEELSKEILTWKKQAVWIFLAFIPSSLMLGATTFITTDVASIPLLWIIPLALYLATMIWSFGRTSREMPRAIIALAIIFAILSIFEYTSQALATNLLLLAGLIFTSLAVIALASHMVLAATRPSTEHLTRYFVLVSFGGALGGAFNSFVAPVIFNSPLEYPIVLALVPLLLAAIKIDKKYQFALVFALFAGIFVHNLNDNLDLEKTRTFYGSYNVRGDETGRSFTHGTTLHGEQSFAQEDEPTTYYSSKGPLGEIFASKEFKDVTAVGLGAGTISTYGTDNMDLTFIEIDGEVLRIAEEYFTYIENSDANVNTIIGDGRLEIGKMPDNSQDFILLDAFSSDSIPIHLLTQEAVVEYQEKLTQDGIMAFHISNRYFDLVPVIVANAEATNMTPLFREYHPGENDNLGVSTVWMTLVPEGEVKENLLGEGWIDLSEVPPTVWTDDYSSILDVLIQVR